MPRSTHATRGPRRRAPAPPGAEPAGPAPAGFPIVGIGASAGGLAAFEQFFTGMPATLEVEIAFVLVQHLAPDHHSLLTDLVRRYTTLEVFEVVDGMVVAPRCVYVIPPNRDLSLSNGVLHLLEHTSPRGQRAPIDHFFRSLARDAESRAVGVVLSGTGSDGALGVRAIKGEGGMVMVQRPSTTEFDGMPRSALATGLVDFELPPAEMPAQLLAYVGRAYRPPRRPVGGARDGEAEALRTILVVLRDQTTHDFSHYKQSTIRRRVERRVAVHQLGSLVDYLAHLQRSPTEVEALFRDLLIGVTSFFRDPEAFDALGSLVVPTLFDDPSGNIRVWCAACSTGEEAYSLAILLQERAEALRRRPRIQVFATDIDARALAVARAGVYPATIASDVSPERLNRFFSLEPDGTSYRVHKSVRDLLVFSEQDLVKDPPFSRLDLVSCRNLLIYLDPELQQRLLASFHYALRPGGTLFLGTSETVGAATGSFAPLPGVGKLYRRTTESPGALQVALGPGVAGRRTTTAALPAGRAAEPARPSLREVTERALLHQVAPDAALVDAAGNVLYLHGRAGAYLELPAGEVGPSNVLALARDALRPALTVALHRAVAAHEVVRCPPVAVDGSGGALTLAVHPVAPHPLLPEEPGLFLVVFRTDPSEPPPTAGRRSDRRLETLRQELKAKEAFLQTANARLQATVEELKSSNEELQSVNEELQSTNEELETSKEELQSVNEEIVTVNTELQTKVTDLSRSNDDISNLLAGTGIGTVFLDTDLRVVRFTPAATQIVPLIPSDVGRPLAHVASNLVGYDRLVADATEVLDSLVPVELEVRTRAGAWYTLRIRPYRTLENRIEGVSVTFVDITEMVRVRLALQEANERARLSVVVRDAHDAVTVQDPDGRILAWNPAATRMYGWTEAEALALHAHDRIPAGLRAEEAARFLRVARNEVVAPYPTRRRTRDGRLVDVIVTATALVDEGGRTYAVSTIEHPAEPGGGDAGEADHGQESPRRSRRT
jgi:two-component system CheB/CheR fusion protein